MGILYKEGYINCVKIIVLYIERQTNCEVIRAEKKVFNIERQIHCVEIMCRN